MGAFDTPYSLIGRGKAGWFAEGHSEDGSVTTSASRGTLDGYVKEANEGALVYDAEGADDDEYTHFILRGPIVDTRLAPGMVDTFKETKALTEMLPGLQDGFRTLALASLAGVSSLDRVSVDVYEKLLRAIPGVKIGKVEGGSVVWESA